MARPMSLMIDGWMPSVGSSSTRSFGRITSARADGELLLLAAGKIAAAPRQHLLQHRKKLEHMRRRALRSARFSGAKPDSRILLHRQQRKHLRALRNECDARPGAIMPPRSVERLPSKAMVPLVSLWWPTIDLIKLVFPTPLRPSTQVILAGLRLERPPRSACAAPWWEWRRLTSSMAARIRV